MQITENNLIDIMPNARSQAGVFVSALNSAIARRHIDSPKRIAAFLAQIGHESGQLRYVRELGNNQHLSSCFGCQAESAENPANGSRIP